MQDKKDKFIGIKNFLDDIIRNDERGKKFFLLLRNILKQLKKNFLKQFLTMNYPKNLWI